MSIATLTDEELAVKEPQLTQPQVAESAGRLRKTLNLDAGQTPELEGELSRMASLPPGLKTRASSAIDALARFIPTEAITLYVAAVAAMPALDETFDWLDAKSAYWIFVCLTPILFLLVFMGKRKTSGLPALPGVTKWPWFKLSASTIAFMVWALAVPTSPYLTGDSGKVVAAFGAVLVSTFLTLLEPVLSRAPAGQ